MLITNGKILIDASGDLQQLDETIELLTKRAKEQGNQLHFDAQSEPIPAYIMPVGLTYDELRELCLPNIDIHFRIIGDEQTAHPVLKRRDIKHIFSPEEKEDLANNLAQREKDKEDLTEEKKSVVKDYNGKIDFIAADISTIASKYREGYEYRNIDVVVIYDFETKQKLYAHPETNEVLDSEAMKAEDYQLRFNLKDSKQIGEVIMNLEQGGAGENTADSNESAENTETKEGSGSTDNTELDELPR